MTKDPTRDEVLARMLKTPPKPFTPKAKAKPSPGKVEKAAAEKTRKKMQP